MDLHIDVVFHDLVLPSVERITTSIRFWFEGFMESRGLLS